MEQPQTIFSWSFITQEGLEGLGKNNSKNMSENDGWPVNIVNHNIMNISLLNVIRNAETTIEADRRMLWRSIRLLDRNKAVIKRLKNILKIQS